MIEPVSAKSAQPQWLFLLQGGEGQDEGEPKNQFPHFIFVRIIPVHAAIVFPHKASIPKGLDHSALGWPDSERAYPGTSSSQGNTLKGLNLKSL